MDEDEAIARLKRGDIGALEVLVRRHQARALDVALLVCRDYALAEDIVQTAFLRAYERIDQFEAGRPFAPWFLRGVINDARKAGSRGPVPLSGLARDPLALAVDTLPDPDALLLAAETQDALWAALGQLSPAQRATVVAHYYLDISTPQLAVQLAVPPGTVRRRLHDARQRLRRLLPDWVR